MDNIFSLFSCCTLQRREQRGLIYKRIMKSKKSVCSCSKIIRPPIIFLWILIRRLNFLGLGESNTRGRKTDRREKGVIKYFLLNWNVTYFSQSLTLIHYY